MPYNAKAIANEFLYIAEQQGADVDPMKIQKLVYYAHSWYLAVKGAPLIDEIIEAWPYGPVIPSLYYEFKEYGASPILRKAVDIDLNTFDFNEPQVEPGDEFIRDLVARIWEVYGGYTSIELSELTHTEGGPWSVTRRKQSEIRNAQIPNDIIKNYFTGMLNGRV